MSYVPNEGKCYIMFKLMIGFIFFVVGFISIMLFIKIDERKNLFKRKGF